MQRRWKTSLILASLAGLLAGGSGAVGGGARRVAGHVPQSRLRASRHLGRHASGDRLSLAVSLVPRDLPGLSELVGGLYDPADPRYGQFLTPEEFRARFAPSDADVTAVSTYLRERGLRVTGVSGNNLLVNVEGSSAEIEDAFQLELHDYATPEGRVAFAPAGEPLVIGEAAERVLAVNGLSSFAARTPRGHRLTRIGAEAVAGRAAVADYMTPAKVRKAYGVDTLAQNGTGETLALFELDGYAASDITYYANYFGLTVPTLQNVLVSDGSSAPSGSAGSNTDEVVLDIEVAMSMAPGLSKIMVYEGRNNDQGVLNTYAKIANDNVAKQVSTSWGSPEDLNSTSFLNSENTIFQQMAAQGQSLFAAAGDSGAYDDYTSRATTLVVDDPASQPYVTSVGGTTLSSNAATGAYTSETSWGTGHSGGGGGISKLWRQPSWQSGLATTANKGSGTMRMVPDVSLDSNPATGYPVYVTYPGQASGWYAFGGTSAAAPAWAAFMAIVNQGRIANGIARLGFANPTLYQIGKSTAYANSFNDIADGSTNLYYPAVAGYDLTTGWGTMKGAALYAIAASGTLPPAPPASFTLIAAPASLTLSWTASSGATSYKIYKSGSAAGPFTLLASTTTTTYNSTVSGLNYYYVTAANAAGESIASAVQSGAPGQSPPGAPTNLTGVVVP